MSGRFSTWELSCWRTTGQVMQWRIFNALRPLPQNAQLVAKSWAVHS
jgi:hypothetical protein